MGTRLREFKGKNEKVKICKNCLNFNVLQKYDSKFQCSQNGNSHLNSSDETGFLMRRRPTGCK
jgi:hypothetical protein